MHWRRFAVSSIPLPASSNPSPKESEVFGNWLLDRWKEKEALLEQYARDGHFPADEGHGSDGKPRDGMIKGAGFIETEVKLAHWHEILNIFSVLGAFLAVAVAMMKTWNLLGPLVMRRETPR